MVFVGIGLKLLGDKFVARHFEHGGEHPAIADAACFEMNTHHRFALRLIFVAMKWYGHGGNQNPLTKGITEEHEGNRLAKKSPVFLCVPRGKCLLPTQRRTAPSSLAEAWYQLLVFSTAR